MNRHRLFVAFMIILVGTAGMIGLKKIQKERAIDDCLSRGGSWIFMDSECKE